MISKAPLCGAGGLPRARALASSRVVLSETWPSHPRMVLKSMQYLHIGNLDLLIFVLLESVRQFEPLFTHPGQNRTCWVVRQLLQYSVPCADMSRANSVRRSPCALSVRPRRPAAGGVVGVMFPCALIGAVEENDDPSQPSSRLASPPGGTPPIATYATDAATVVGAFSVMQACRRLVRIPSRSELRSADCVPVKTSLNLNPIPLADLRVCGLSHGFHRLAKLCSMSAKCRYGGGQPG